jgi:hypothetical protein
VQSSVVPSGKCITYSPVQQVVIYPSRPEGDFGGDGHGGVSLSERGSVEPTRASECKGGRAVGPERAETSL